MSILSYFKPKDGLPDELEGSLSSILPSQAIAYSNKEVEKVISEKGDTKKRGATRDGVSIRCVVGLPLRAKLLHELDSICFCTRGDHEYNILFEVLPSGTRALVVCTQNFVVKKISLLKNLRRTRSQTKIF